MLTSKKKYMDSVSYHFITLFCQESTYLYNLVYMNKINGTKTLFKIINKKIHPYNKFCYNDTVTCQRLT